MHRYSQRQDAPGTRERLIDPGGVLIKAAGVSEYAGFGCTTVPINASRARSHFSRARYRSGEYEIAWP